MSRRAFIVYRHPLFGDAVRLLLTHGGIQVLGMESDWDSARKQITALRPDVVLLELEGDDTPPIWTPSDWAEVGAKQPMTIGVSLLDNRAYIWHREDKVLMEATDLVQLIQSR